VSLDARRGRLIELHAQVRSIILDRQDPATGLLPASTAVTVHGDYTHAWVRDNVYSILAVWALALAYRRVDGAASPPLEAAVIRLMRGLLAAMMRQAHKVECFKHTQDPLDALHAKYDTARGEPVVGDAEWGHLQIDATAIFVLMLAQMSASGLRLVEQPDEQAFVQNLVHYLAKAYRTPDYGIWERGHKRNEGQAELNASSVGMAKAALEAIAGFDPLPGRAAAVQVIEDDIAHARDALQALLPRESESKETDAALLAIVGYPAFAVEDDALVERTRSGVLGKLRGRYGCRRFLRDGHQTVLEDHARLHYEPGELQQFEHIESEWPLFFTYLLIDAGLRGDAGEAADWRASLEALMQERDGQRLLPELYLVPADAVDAERARPHSQAFGVDGVGRTARRVCPTPTCRWCGLRACTSSACCCRRDSSKRQTSTRWTAATATRSDRRSACRCCCSPRTICCARAWPRKASNRRPCSSCSRCSCSTPRTSKPPSPHSATARRWASAVGRRIRWAA
jgi:phosphorylase kinase alpha/beta subunit